MPVQTKRKQALNFAKVLLNWNARRNKRQMPWKGEKDPYKVWLSEIILQQTRVEQGLKYYESFINTFPDVHSLANAADQKIYKLWEGLGYYSRCRNLIETARYVSKHLNGNFPTQYEEIKKLKGVGPYTAAAISSFAFNEPRAVIDGNVFRVLSRTYAINKPIDETKGKIFFNRLANDLLDKRQPGLYNQAIMDFGATICKPVPECRRCPFTKYCKAFLTNKISDLPVKTKQVVVQKRWFYYLLVDHNGKVAIRQRVEKDIWHNLFEFLLLEFSSSIGEEEISERIRKRIGSQRKGFEIQSVSPVFRQKLSHQLIEGRFMILKTREKPKLPGDVIWINKTEIKNYAFPRFINQYLHQLKI